MLTDKLDDIAARISAARRPQYFLLYTKTGDQPILRKVTLEDFFSDFSD
jgi:hypothetical protein